MKRLHAFKKELHVAEQMELQARHRALHEEVERARVQRITGAATTKAAEWAQKALEQHKQQRLWAAKAAEMARGCQGGRSSEDAIAGELEVHRAHIAS